METGLEQLGRSGPGPGNMKDKSSEVEGGSSGGLESYTFRGGGSQRGWKLGWWWDSGGLVGVRSWPFSLGTARSCRIVTKAECGFFLCSETSHLAEWRETGVVCWGGGGPRDLGTFALGDKQDGDSVPIPPATREAATDLRLVEKGKLGFRALQVLGGEELTWGRNKRDPGRGDTGTKSPR